jgi:hypothetical protein
VGAVSGKTFSFSIVQALFLNQIFCPGKAYLSNIKEDDFLKSAEVDNLITLSPRKNENIQFRINSQRQLIQTKATGDAGRLSFQWNYNEFAAASKIIFPNRMEIDLTTSKNKLTGSMVFSRIEWNKPLNTECAIPSRYSRVEASEIFKLISTM